MNRMMASTNAAVTMNVMRNFFNLGERFSLELTFPRKDWDLPVASVFRFAMSNASRRLGCGLSESPIEESTESIAMSDMVIVFTRLVSHPGFFMILKFIVELKGGLVAGDFGACVFSYPALEKVGFSFHRNEVHPRKRVWGVEDAREP